MNLEEEFRWAFFEIFSGDAARKMFPYLSNKDALLMYDIYLKEQKE